MRHELIALIASGSLCAGALVMLVLKRRGVAKGKAARGGREVNLSNIFDAAFGDKR